MRTFKMALRVKWILMFLILGFACLTAACALKTDEERITAINKRIAPEGHLTTTHLYIDWPAEYESGKEVAKPLKLKIPIEYLVPAVSFTAKTPIEYVAESLLVQDKKITSIYLRMLPNAKPYEPLLPTKNLPPDEAKRKTDYSNSSYAVIISRKPSYYQSGYRGTLKGTQEADVAGLVRYVETECYDIEELKTHSSPSDKKTPNVDLQRALDNIASKAKDDHSPENCYENRAWQNLATPAEMPAEQALYVTCGEGLFCDANANLQGRNVQMVISQENSIIEYKRKIIAARDPKAPFVTFPQPMLDQVWTDITKWQERIDPTRTLLNSFVVTELPKEFATNN